MMCVAIWSFTSFSDRPEQQAENANNVKVKILRKKISAGQFISTTDRLSGALLHWYGTYSLKHMSNIESLIATGNQPLKRLFDSTVPYGNFRWGGGWGWEGRGEQERNGLETTVLNSFGDPDPDPDPHVCGPPGSGSISQRSESGFGSGSFPFLIRCWAD